MVDASFYIGEAALSEVQGCPKAGRRSRDLREPQAQAAAGLGAHPGDHGAGLEVIASTWRAGSSPVMDEETGVVAWHV